MFSVLLYLSLFIHTIRYASAVLEMAFFNDFCKG